MLPDKEQLEDHYRHAEVIMRWQTVNTREGGGLEFCWLVFGNAYITAVNARWRTYLEAIAVDENDARIRLNDNIVGINVTDNDVASVKTFECTR